MAGVYNIPSWASFLDCLAQGLLHQTQDDPLRLSQYQLFLPTRRACIELQKAFLRQNSGKPLLLPKMLPLGDLDQEEELILNTPLPSLPSVLPTFKRQGLLTKLILHYTEQHEGLVSPHSAASATQLAKELMTLIDEAQVEGVSWDNLADLVPTHLATHWQITLDFLKIISEHWPQILADTHHVEPHTYNTLAVERLIERWENHPPQAPIIGAGSTGTRSTTAQLLKAISQLEQGTVLLPGFEASANPLLPTHPHFAHHQLLDKLNVDPHQVEVWPLLEEESESTPQARAQLFLKSIAHTPEVVSHPMAVRALERLTLLEAPTPQAEALNVALLIRETLETPEKTVALVTPDPSLVERIKAELERWGIPINEGAKPLNTTLQGSFLRLLLKVAMDNYEAHALLALLKHPYLCIEGEDQTWVTHLEKEVLRGPALKPGIASLLNKAADIKPLQRLDQLLAPLLALMSQDGVEIRRFLEELLTCAHTLTTEDSPLWLGTEGESLSQFFSDLMEASPQFPKIKGADFPEFFETLMASHLCAKRFQGHPRLAILKPFEARLYHADHMILAGLNEGSWPQESQVDPWLSRPMRQDLGLSPLEQQIGLSAHDFYQAFCGSKVTLSRSLRNGGTPTVPSRWLLRLEVTLEKLDLEINRKTPVNSWRELIDVPETFCTPRRPNPCPPVEARPRQLSVTQIETWMRDPYALYARHILGLIPLDDIALAPGAADRGTLFHRAFEEFIKEGVSPHDETAYDQLIEIGRRLFAPLKDHVDVAFFWWPRFQSIAQWFIEKQKGHPPTQYWTELKGSLTFETSQGPFTLKARADRIDQTVGGQVTIIDYKTGTPPTFKDIEKGFSPQLPLEAAIACTGGFQNILPTVTGLEFWWLKGGKDGGAIRSLKGNIQELASEALEGLKSLVAYYNEPSTSYPAAPWPSKALIYNDYAHLARIQEWRGR